MYKSWLIVVALYFLTYSSIHATSLVLSDVPESIPIDDSFTVTASFSGSKSSCGLKTYYLRGVLFQNSGDDLFGYTKNNQDEWISMSELPSRLFSFTTSDEGTWSGQLLIKGDHESSGFKGQGTYQVRLDRYTQTGTSKAESSNGIPITFLYTPPPTPTPTPTPSASSGSTATPTPTPTPSTGSGPTATPVATSALITTPSPSPISIIETDTGDFSSSTSSQILGLSHTSTESSQQMMQSASEKNSILIPVIIVLGGICMVTGGLSLGTSLLGNDSN